MRFKKRVALLNRNQASRAHDDSKLGIGQANHVPEDAGNMGRDIFAPMEKATTDRVRT